MGVPGAKPHDWDSLRREYLKGGYRTLKHFAEHKKISVDRLRHVAAKEKWEQMKKKVKHVLEAKIALKHAKEVDQAVDKGLSEVDRMNQRHRGLATSMITAGVKHVKKSGANAQNVVSMIKEGVNIERMTYGEDQGTMNVTIITNVPEPDDVKEWMKKYGSRLRTSVNAAAQV